MNLTELIAAGMEPAAALKLRAKLYLKVEKLANNIGALKKEGSTSLGGGRGYKYITHEQVTDALRPLLLKHKLSVVVEVTDYSERDFKTVNRYKAEVYNTRSVVSLAIRLTDTETGFSDVLKFAGAEQDNGGKSMQQAISQAVKYAMFKIFKISENETDGDKSIKEIKNEQPAQQPPNNFPAASKEKPKEVKKTVTTQAVNSKAVESALEKITTVPALESLWKGLTAAQRADADIIDLIRDKKNELTNPKKEKQ